jgi:hypothetical protein
MDSLRSIVLDTVRKTPNKVLIVCFTWVAVGFLNIRYKILYRLYNDLWYSEKTEKRKLIFEYFCKN